MFISVSCRNYTKYFQKVYKTTKPVQKLWGNRKDKRNNLDKSGIYKIKSSACTLNIMLRHVNRLEPFLRSI